MRKITSKQCVEGSVGKIHQIRYQNFIGNKKRTCSPDNSKPLHLFLFSLLFNNMLFNNMARQQEGASQLPNS
jgi:hypothetical protein